MEYEGTQENGSEAELGHVAPERQAAAAAAVNGGIPLLADANNVVLLPEGATLDDISVRGRDLVITLDDGRVYVIADGAVFVPQIVIDGVSVPPMNLAALLTSNEPQPAAGPVSSSGGNFAEAVNPIQDAFELGNLLPYTELAFPEPREEEIFPWLYDRDEEPTIAIITGDNPAGVQSAVSTVHEAGLAARGNKPAGTDAQSDSETTTGTITFNAPDGLASIALNGVVITNVGQTITTAQGVLTITSISGGSIGYSYTLTDNILGPPSDEVFIATVTDADGDTATATLTITIKDDAPIARPDFDNVTEDGPLVADGNVLTGSGGSDANGTDGVADTQGADGAVVSTTGTFVGQYGTLVLNADGSYVYTLDNTNPYVQALSEGETLNEVFPYTLTDGDGDTSSTTLTITINGADDGVTINGLDVTGGAVIVNEENLAWGSSPDAGALTQTGSFTVTSPDGLADVTVGGVVVVSGGVFTPQTITTPQGILTITGFTPTTGGGVITGGTFTYSYELTSDTPGHGAPGEDTVSDSFPVVVTDRDGSRANASLDVTVIDDVPTARDDAAISVAEDFAGTVGGNVIANDTQGADGATLTSVTIAGTTTAISPVGSTTITTPHGVYVFDASGAWTFDPANGLDNTAGIDASFSYVITDGDGDQSTAVQPITITDGDKPTAGAPISLVLDDQNLPNGSTPAGSDSATATIVFAPGSDAIASIVFGTDLSGLGGGLTWTRISDTQITGTDGGRPVVTLDLVRVGDGAQVTATLDGNYAGHTGINIDDVADLGSIGVVATDTDGDTATGTVNLSVSDDLPQVSASSDELPALVVDETAFATDASASFADAFAINYGADGSGGVTYALAVTAGPSGLVDTLSGQPVILSLTASGVVEGRTAGGDLVFTVTVDANGVVTLNQSRAVEHSDTSDHDDATTLSAADLVRLTATATDGDGDTASATINIGDKLLFRDDGPSIEAAVVDGDTILLTTHDAQTVGDDSDTSVSSANFSGAFSLAHSSHGADGAGTVTWSYALSVTNPVSGLSSNGAAITLSLNAGVVEGRTASGDLIFTLQADANGVVTLTQHAEIDHAPNNGTAPYDTQLAVLGNGLVQLSGTATITDGDGDSASDTVHLDLGGNVRFADDGPAITTTDALIKVTVDESYFPYDASANFAAAFAVNYGADGAGSVTYALAVTAGPSGLVDTLSGQPVILSLTAGGVVEGRTAGGDLVFTVTVDANGVVTLDQSRAIVHSDTSDHDDAATLSAADLVRLTATVTDGDGDTASATINIGDKLLFRDDGPSIEAAVIDGDTILLTTHDAQTIGDDSDTSVSSANFSGSFSLAHSSHGADGAGTVTWSYALSVTNPVSGLSSNGAAITLSLNAGVVEGRTEAGDLIFTLQTDANGVVTLTQHAEIDHAPNNGTAPYDTQLAVLGNGLVQLSGTATITDRDGDSASDTVHLDLGGNVRFADDGPAITTTDAQIKVTVDESYFPYDASANFAAAFAVNYGADGAGSVTYALAVTAGPSGLVDTLSGQPVILSLTAGGVVEGRTAGGDLVFTVTVDANGVVTLDQSRAIVHSDPNDHDDAATLSAADLVRLTATATDGDGDAASATINIGDRLVFRDAGPTINIVANGTTLVVDESLGVVGSGQNEGGAANDDEVATGAAPGAIGYASGILHADAGTNAGSDGLASQVYSLAVGSAASGLVDTVSNQNVVLTLTATGVVEGRTAIGNELVFSLAVDADTGEVHFNQFRAIRHNDTSDHDENGASAATLLAGSVSLEVALTDGDGDTARDSIDISTALKFEDDGPVAVADSALMITGMADGLPAAPISGSLTANDDFGTDGGRVQSITIGSATYTWNGTTAISVSDGGTLTGTVLSAETPLGGTLTFDFASGVWSYKAPASVDAPTNEVFAYTIVDGDGDTAASALTIIVRNDGVPSTVPVTATLDEDGLPGGIAGGADDLDANLGADGVPGGGDDDLDGPDSSEATFSGVLGITYGSDGPGTVSFAQLDGTTVAVGVETATLTWNADSQTLTATGPRGALFTVELTDESTGAYKVTLLDNVLHPAGEAENDATVSLTYGLTDGNGTAGNGVLNIIFDDDKLGIFETSEISLGTGLSSTGVFTYGIGADSRGSYSVADGDFTSVVLSGRVGSGAITNVTTTKTGETASSATFAFSFSYDADPSTAGMQEATSSGILSFNKATGQFTFTLDERLASHDETVGGGAKAPEFSLDIDVTITDTDGDAVSSTLNVRGVAAPMADGIAGLLADTAFAADRQSRETGRAVETAAVAAAASALIAATLTVDVPPALAAADPRPVAQGVETAPAATLAEAGDSQAAQDHKASDLLGDTGPAALVAPESNAGADAGADAPTQLTSVVDHAETTPALADQQAEPEPAISHALLSDGAGTMQAMEALLALQAPPAPEDSAPNEPQAAAEIPVVEEALADARDAAFVDVLIDRLGGSADHAGPAAPQEGADIAKALSAHVDGGATVIQSAFDLAQMAHDASAQAAAQHV